MPILKNGILRRRFKKYYFKGNFETGSKGIMELEGVPQWNTDLLM